ncbi:hypothetical protein [Streptomyces sp. NPDC088736]|uniref:hypothetical protein n=1 Tax=Streptomyces sp. NPDC088736 TaxID=3365881 RepID=UPI0038268242
MARLQILELPTVYRGEEPGETPFVLVIDQLHEGLIDGITAASEKTAELIGARTILAFTDTIEIPANDTSARAPQSGCRCGEHDGPCFPEAGATCVAHGDTECPYCHRNPADCATGGNCSVWERTGMHWDSCANRVRGPLASGVPDDHQLPELVYAHERTRLELCDALLVSRDTTWRKLVEAVSDLKRWNARLGREFDAVTSNPAEVRVYLGENKIDVQEISRQIADEMKRGRSRGES